MNTYNIDDKYIVGFYVFLYLSLSSWHIPLFLAIIFVIFWYGSFIWLLIDANSKLELRGLISSGEGV